MSKKKKIESIPETEQNIPKGWLSLAICPRDAAILLRCIRYGRNAVSEEEFERGFGDLFQARCNAIAADIQDELLDTLMRDR